MYIFIHICSMYVYIYINIFIFSQFSYLKKNLVIQLLVFTFLVAFLELSEQEKASRSRKFTARFIRTPSEFRVIC